MYFWYMICWFELRMGEFEGGNPYGFLTSPRFHGHAEPIKRILGQLGANLSGLDRLSWSQLRANLRQLEPFWGQLEPTWSQLWLTWSQWDQLFVPIGAN